MIACVILSIIFVITSFSLVIYYSIGGLLHPNSIETVVKNIEYVEVFKDSKELDTAFTDLGLDDKTKDAVLKSDAFENLCDEIAIEFTDSLINSNGDTNVSDVDMMKDIINNHKDKILVVVEENSDKPMEEQELSDKIDDVFENKSTTIEDTFSKLEPIKEMVVSYKTNTQVLIGTFEWYYIVIFCFIELLILSLIYIIRHKNFGGFIWIAVNTGIAGLLISVITLIVSSGLITKSLSTLPNFATFFVDSAINYIVTRLVVALIIFFVIMAAAITSCIMLKKKKSMRDSAVL